MRIIRGYRWQSKEMRLKYDNNYRRKQKQKKNKKVKVNNLTNLQISHRLYLKSDLWKNRRDLYFATHEEKCLKCGTTNNINLHHAIYDESSVSGEELDEHLFPLCNLCHRRFHALCKNYRNRLKDTISFIKGEIDIHTEEKDKETTFTTSDKSPFRFPKMRI